jgi:hypothetical protein
MLSGEKKIWEREIENGEKCKRTRKKTERIRKKGGRKRENGSKRVK